MPFDLKPRTFLPSCQIRHVRLQPSPAMLCHRLSSLILR